MYVEALSDLVASFDDELRAIKPASDADMLRHFTEAKGVTQAQLSRDTAVAKSTVSEILAGKKRFSRQMIRKFADYFEVDTSLLAATSELESAPLSWIAGRLEAITGRSARILQASPCAFPQRLVASARGAALFIRARKAAFRWGSFSNGSARTAAATRAAFFFSRNRPSTRRSASGRRVSASRRACCRRAGDVVSQILTVPSPEPDTMLLPSGLNSNE